VNRILEQNSRPVIWISNAVDSYDPAYIRRFDFHIIVNPPDDKARLRMWKKLSKKHKVVIDGAELSSLARSYDIGPAAIETAILGAALTERSEVIPRVIENMQTTINGRAQRQAKKLENEFYPELLNTDINLGKLADRIVQQNMLKFSLCLYGVSGSGKSAFAIWLANRLNMKYIHKRASDLISALVGETEKNIAAAFKEATEKKAMLIFDEADSFLQDRSRAIRSWEISQTNEMLTQMETATYPFICTTNLVDTLDKASMRRFSFMVKYDFMKGGQAAIAFEKFFGAPPPSEFTGLRKLVPADFSVVRKQAEVLGALDNHNELMELLVKTVRAKGGDAFSVGFNQK